MSAVLRYFVSLITRAVPSFFFFFFNDTATTEIYTLSLHDALPISFWKDMAIFVTEDDAQDGTDHIDAHRSLLMVISKLRDRKSTRLNSSHGYISYAVFCLKKKKNITECTTCGINPMQLLH